MAVTRDMAKEYLRQARDVLGSVDTEDVEAFTNVLYEAWKSENTIFVCGNGGSAGTAQHMAADLFKCTIVTGKPRVRVMSLNDNMPLISALTNDDGWDEVYIQQLMTWWRPGDVVLGISVHGGSGQDKAGLWSQNILKALHFANDHGGKSLGLVGFDGGAMKEVCSVSLVVPVESTPHTEGLHVVMHHMITTLLRTRIEESK